MRDLKAIGAHNANAGRPRGLTARGAFDRMVAEYETHRRDGLLPATYEVVYGQAWCPTSPARGRSAAGEVAIPLSRIGRRPSLGTDRRPDD
jgi:malonyl-CoA O-methyltransferase